METKTLIGFLVLGIAMVATLYRAIRNFLGDTADAQVVGLMELGVGCIFGASIIHTALS